MRRRTESIRRWFVAFGIDTRKAGRAMKGLADYRRDLSALRQQAEHSKRAFPLARSYPCLDDRHSGNPASGHYFHQDLLIARRIFDARPEKHVDIGSRVDGFVAHVACFRPIEVLDIRPLESQIPNVTFTQADLMQPVGDDLSDYCDSLSCLHAIEHFGLGRYGDPVDYDGYLSGIENLRRILRTGGRLYLSVPIGRQRIEFNAHRVFSVRYLFDLLEPFFGVDRFSYVDDRGDLHEDVELTDTGIRNSFACTYGCGILELTRL